MPKRKSDTEADTAACSLDHSGIPDDENEFSHPKNQSPKRQSGIPYRSDGLEIEVTENCLDCREKRGFVKPPNSGGLRGPVRGLSADSARRFRRQFARLPWRLYLETFPHSPFGRAFFITLTPGPVHATFSDFKSYLKTWYEELGVVFPVEGMIWVLQLQQRGAAHIHAVIFMAARVSWRSLRDFMAESWCDLTGATATDVRTCFANKYSGGVPGFVRRMSFYMSKKWQDENYDGGRVWGHYGKLPVAKTVKFRLSQADEIEFLRRVRRYRRNSGFLSSRALGRGGFILYGDPAVLFQLLRGLDVQWISGLDEDSTDSS